MQGNNGQQGSGQKQGGLSWTQSPSANTNNNSQNTGGAKPISQVPPPVTSKPQAAVSSNTNSGSNQNNNQNNKKPGSDTKNNNSGSRSNGGGRTFGIFVAGIIVGLIVGWGWFSLRTDDKVADTTGTAATTSTAGDTTSGTTDATAPATTNTNSQGVSTGSTSSGSLTLASPQDAGLAAMVSDLAVGVPTWVVVYDNVGGKPGNVLGARLFFPGEKSGTVTLLRATGAGQTYFAGEYVDNGDHSFSKQTDTLVTGITGSPLMAQFTTK